MTSRLHETNLKIAFYERNPDMAREVRKSKPALTIKELLRYYGAGHDRVHSFVCAVENAKSFFRKIRSDTFSHGSRQ